MASVWSSATPFCPRCGTLLVFPDVGDVVCDKCDFACRMCDMPALTVVTRSYPKPEPEWLAEYHAAEAAAAGGPAAALGDKKAKRAVVNEECPKCKSPRMEFYTMQLRSADEGQTVRAGRGGGRRGGEGGLHTAPSVRHTAPSVRHTRSRRCVRASRAWPPSGHPSLSQVFYECIRPECGHKYSVNT
jgi:DNA-directed RNA polymerase I subunit RPA12